MSQPIRIAYDISRLTAGGANGGIKVHHYEFLRHFAEHFPHKLQLLVFCQEEILPELTFLGPRGINQIHVLGPRKIYDARDFDGSHPVIRYWPDGAPEDMLPLLEIDALYAGFGFSQLYHPQVPQISLIVDALHRVYPEALPPEEVRFREKWYSREIKRSKFVQTNSLHCKQLLVEGFEADADKIVTISVPTHGRYNTIEMGLLPDSLAGKDHHYFLYPAHFWPHKNHQRLIEGYAHYAKQRGSAALDLVLTGDINSLGKECGEQIAKLGLEGSVHQLGHLDIEMHKAVWELAHSLVFPSLYEGFGIPILEACYFQKPLAVSQLPYAEEVAPANAHKFDPTTPNAIARALDQLHDSPEPHRARPDHLLQYQLNDQAKKLLEVFIEQIIGRNLFTLPRNNFEKIDATSIKDE